jgi:succinoglycan biosynthesis protein ExoA
MTSSQPTLGIVVAVRNEAQHLPAFLQSLARQGMGLERVMSIAIVDGESEDGSRGIAVAYKGLLRGLDVLDNPRRVTPVAFNIGTRHCLARGCDAVTILGAHGQLSDTFLLRLADALARVDADVLGTVHDYSPARSRMERAVQMFSESRLGRGLARYTALQKPTQTDVAFCPTIRRGVFEKVGLFDEAMIRNQDNEFIARVRAAGLRIVTDPALRYTYAPRSRSKDLFRQMRGNGFWVGVRPQVHGWRHWSPFAFYGVLLTALTIAVVLRHPLAWAMCLGAFAPYALALLTVSILWTVREGSAALLLPFLLFGGHAAYALGTLQGLVDRPEKRGPSQCG